MSDNLMQVIQTFCLAIAGTAVFWFIEFPLPFLFGPMAACLTGALAGLPLRGVPRVSKATRTILGVAVGTSITPAVIAQLPAMAASVALIPLYLILIAAIGVPYFYKVIKLDKVTAYYAAMPGGFQDMVVFGEEAGADIRALSLIHATRVLFVVVLAPIVATSFFGAALDNPIGTAIMELLPHELLLMVVAAILSLGDLIHSRPPAEAILAAQFFIGMGVGVHYSGIVMAEVRRFVVSGVIFFALLASLAAVFSLLVAYFGLARPLEGFLAFAPGGQAEMTVLSIIVGVDLGFVIIHHLTRIVLVISGAPIVAKYLLGNRP